MIELINDIKSKLSTLESELDVVASGVRNKAAARRARKITLELTKVFKDFRKESVKI